MLYVAPGAFNGRIWTRGFSEKGGFMPTLSKFTIISIMSDQQEHLVQELLKKAAVLVLVVVASRWRDVLPRRSRKYFLFSPLAMEVQVGRF